MKMKAGTVKWFNLQKGHGFIRPDGGPNIFVDNFAVECAGMHCLTEGQRIIFEIRSDKRTGSPGAKVEFVDLKDGAIIGPKTTIHFGLHGMGVAPAGTKKANSGHHHLLIDADLPPLDQPIPNDAGANWPRRRSFPERSPR